MSDQAWSLVLKLNLLPQRSGIWQRSLYTIKGIRAFSLSLSMPCEDQEERTHQGSHHAGPLISDFQPPERWEVNVCCLSLPLFGICYSSLNWPRHFLLFHLCNLNWPVFRSAHEPHPAISLCSYRTLSLQNLYIFFLKVFFWMFTIFKSLLNWLCWLKKKMYNLRVVS